VELQRRRVKKRRFLVMIGAIARQGNRRVIAPFFSSNCSLTEVEMPTAYTTRPALNFDAPEPVVTGDPNASALFPSQPVYARTPKKKASNNLPLSGRHSSAGRRGRRPDLGHERQPR
jgi:hypothetical protein